MKLIRASVIAIALLSAPSALGQSGQSASADVQRVAQTAIAYGESLQIIRGNLQVIWSPNQTWNAPPDAIRASIDRARRTLAQERTRIAALPAPNLRGETIDLTFVGLGLRDKANRQLNTVDATLAAAEAMFAAQSAGDCAALEAHAAEFDRRRLDAFEYDLADNVRRLETFSADFAGGDLPPPVPIDPTPNELVVDYLADFLAKTLRCPVLGPDVRFELVARVQSDGTVLSTISNLNDADMRASLEQRLATAGNFGNRQLAGRSISLVWSGQRLQRSP